MMRSKRFLLAVTVFLAVLSFSFLSSSAFSEESLEWGETITLLEQGDLNTVNSSDHNLIDSQSVSEREVTWRQELSELPVISGRYVSLDEAKSGIERFIEKGARIFSFGNGGLADLFSNDPNKRFSIGRQEDMVVGKFSIRF